MRWGQKRDSELVAKRAVICAAAACTFLARVQNVSADATWNVNADGSWSTPSNWGGPIPSLPGDIATFGPIISTNRTVTVDTPFTVGGVVLSSSSPYTLAGPGTLTFSSPGTASLFAKGSFTTTISAPINLSSPLQISTSGLSASSILLSGSISGNGNLTFAGPGTLTVSGANGSWGGSLVVGGGTLVVNNSAALGTSSAPTTVAGGQMTINQPVTESIILNAASQSNATLTLNATPTVTPTLVSGTVVVNHTMTFAGTSSIGTGLRMIVSDPGVHFGTVSVNGGTWTYSTTAGQFTDPIVLNSGTVGGGAIGSIIASPIQLNGPHGTISGNGLYLFGGTTGTGNLYVGGTGFPVEVNGPLAHNGGVTTIGTVDFNANVASFTGLLDVLQSSLFVRENNTVVNALIDDGVVVISPGKTLTSPNPIEFRNGGSISGNVSAPSLLVTSGGWFFDVGAFAGSIDVEGGTALLTGSTGFGTASAGAFVNGANSAVVIKGGLTCPTNVYLNNAAGPNAQGGLQVFDSNGQSNAGATLTGALNLGTAGSTVSGVGGSLTLAGPISGGSINVLGSVAFTGNSNSYTGATRVKGFLSLSGNGAISNSSQITIEAGAGLYLQNSGSLNLPDRLADAAPITLRGGTLQLIDSNSANAAEVVGAVTFDLGMSNILASNPDDNPQTPVVLTLSSINRQQGAIASFGGTAYSSIKITSLPTLHNGIIGGWALCNSNFATYDSSGVNYLTSFTPLSSATAVSNVGVSTDSLSSTKMINSLTLFTGVSTATLDLGGNTLTIDTGGIVGAGTIKNGWLTAGSSSELFVPSGTIFANIVDGAQPISVVGLGGTHLAGSNTYSGSTYIAGGYLYIESAPSLPSGTPLFIDSTATFDLDYVGAGSLSVGTVNLRGGSVIATTGSPSINATAYTLESGQISAVITGNGPMHKTTDGTVTLSSNNAGYSGPVTIDGGVLIAGAPFVSSAHALGSGTIAVNSGAELYVNTSLVTSQIALNGGSLLLVGSVTGPVSASGNTTIDSVSGVSAGLSGGLSILPLATTQMGTSGATITVANSVNYGTVNIGGGTVIFSSITGSGTTSIGASSQLNVNSIRQNSLTVGGRVQLHTGSGVSRVTSLAIAGTGNDWSGRLDIGDNTMIVDQPASLAGVRSQLLSGYNSGFWSPVGPFSGNGITSSSAASNSTKPNKTAIGFSTAGNLGTNSFAGESVDSSALILKYTYFGDANLDGTVNTADFTMLANHFGSPTQLWSDGDFNYDGVVNALDFNAIATNFGQTLSSPALGIVVPEPGSLVAMAIVGVGCCRRRRTVGRA